MSDEPVTVPPEVRDGLKRLQEAGALHEGDPDRAIEWAKQQDLEATVRWVERVGPGIFDRAANGLFVGGDER